MPRRPADESDYASGPDLLRIRIALDLTLRAIEERGGPTESFWSKVERCLVPPSERALHRAARAMEIDVEIVRRGLTVLWHKARAGEMGPAAAARVREWDARRRAALK